MICMNTLLDFHNKRFAQSNQDAFNQYKQIELCIHRMHIQLKIFTILML